MFRQKETGGTRFAVDFLKQVAPGNHYLYAYDWRKSPQKALFGLDRLIERARCSGSLPPGETTCPDAGT